MTRSERIRALANFYEDITSDASDIYIIFVDLVGSTKYKLELANSKQSDILWISRQLIFLQRAADIIEEHKGTIVKTIGDEIMGFFPFDQKPEGVLKTGIEIIQAYENLKSFTGKDAIKAKVSIDFGITYNGSIDSKTIYDPIGTCVDRCARLNSAAASDEILMSIDFYKRLLENVDEENINSIYGIQKEENTVLKGLSKQTIYRMNANGSI